MLLRITSLASPSSCLYVMIYLRTFPGAASQSRFMVLWVTSVILRFPVGRGTAMGWERNWSKRRTTWRTFWWDSNGAKKFRQFTYRWHPDRTEGRLLRHCEGQRWTECRLCWGWGSPGGLLSHLGRLAAVKVTRLDMIMGCCGMAWKKQHNHGNSRWLLWHPFSSYSAQIPYESAARMNILFIFATGIEGTWCESVSREQDNFPTVSSAQSFHFQLNGPVWPDLTSPLSAWWVLWHSWRCTAAGTL